MCKKAFNTFKSEVSLLTRLVQHTSILMYLDYFINENKFYLVTQWIGGGDLAQQMRVRGGTVNEATVTKWAIQICDVLHYLHSQQPPIIYRDIKPTHLILDDKTGRIMLVGFNLANIMRPIRKGEEIRVFSTLGYVPPELFAGRVEPRNDIYSLGATMFHLLTGSDPQDNPLLIFDFSKNPRPQQINPKISECMEKILMKMVAYDVVDRPQSALQLMRELQEHLQQLMTAD